MMGVGLQGVLLQVLFILHLRGHRLPQVTDSHFIIACVTNHNQARAQVQPPATNMRYMTWDVRLAEVARAWGEKCVFEHNIKLRERKPVHPELPSVGENIWAGAPPSIFTVESAVEQWVKEVQDYNYHTLECRDVCGHYTQVVWAESYKVGCAVVDCPSGVRGTNFSHRPGAIFICNYATAGNYKGVHPYRTGPACSGCVGESCEEKLCRNSTRDSVRGSSRGVGPYHGSSPSTGHIVTPWTVLRPVSGNEQTRAGVCDEFCIAVVMIRPLSLLFIFISVYVAQRRYPNLFAYIK